MMHSPLQVPRNLAPGGIAVIGEQNLNIRITELNFAEVFAKNRCFLRCISGCSDCRNRFVCNQSQLYDISANVVILFSNKWI